MDSFKRLIYFVITMASVYILTCVDLTYVRATLLLILSFYASHLCVMASAMAKDQVGIKCCWVRTRITHRWLVFMILSCIGLELNIRSEKYFFTFEWAKDYNHILICWSIFWCDFRNIFLFYGKLIKRIIERRKQNSTKKNRKTELNT